MTPLEETIGRLTKLSDDVGALFDAHPNRDFTLAQVEEIQAKNREMAELGLKRDGLMEIEAAGQRAERERQLARQPVSRPTFEGNGRPSETAKTFRDYLHDHQGYAAFREGQRKTAVLELSDVEVKTLLTLADINNPPTRLPQIVGYAVEERTVADLMAQGTTDNNTFTYMEETTFTNAAAEVSEGGSKPESALDFTERTENVRKIATWLPATDELLSDVRGMDSYIRARLMFMVKRREEQQLLSGDGTAPNISGILDRSGIQTQAKGADPTPDAIYKAMTKIRSIGFAEPTAVVAHPNDWQDVKLLRTTDGIYIWGSPSASDPMDRIWGLEVRITTAMTENTMLVGAFKPDAQIFRREGITVTISTEHSTYFIENKVAILAEERLALAVYRPASFCTVTGV